MHGTGPVAAYGDACREVQRPGDRIRAARTVSGEEALGKEAGCGWNGSRRGAALVGWAMGSREIE